MARGAGPARKKSLNPGDNESDVNWDWDKTSTPLVGKGKECKFIKPSDKFSSTEGENVFCTLDIVGDPVPTVTWFKASKDLTTEPRCKQWTNAPNQIILGFSKTKQEDEGEYRVEIENEHGMVEHVFSLYVTGEPNCTVGTRVGVRNCKITRYCKQEIYNVICCERVE